jgi:hypothetical protein
MDIGTDLDRLLRQILSPAGEEACRTAAATRED